MPKIGLTMTEGKIVEWKKREGEWVEKGEILFVFETEKVTIEVEAQQSGYLVNIMAQIGDVVPVGGVVGLISENPGDRAVPETRADAGGRSAGGERTDGIDEGQGKIRATPMARRIAKARGIDLKMISSAGGRRIKKEDVETAAPPESGAQVQSTPRAENGRVVALTGMRKVIAQKMLASKTEAAQTYMVITADATNIIRAREILTPLVSEKVGVRPTITDLLMKIAASAIAAHPVMNTRWSDEGIIWFDDVHMGMAMALKEGLIVPVIWNVGRKSLSEVTKARADAVEKGRAGRLTPDDMKGSTFTLSSLGMFGIEEFTAIINQPESAILAVGAIVDKPVAANGQIVIRPTMKVTLSYDHRVIDGAKAAEYMKTLKEYIENPILIIA